MKRLITLALMGFLGVAGVCYSQEIPGGVKEYMYQLQHDPAVVYGFDYAKKRRYIEHNVQFQNWYVGLPFQFYRLNLEKLESSTIDSNFEDLIEPTNKWCIPIRVNNNYVYHAYIYNDSGGFTPGGCGSGVIGFKTWDKVRKKFPEKSGVRPIYIPYPFQLLFFPHKTNGKKIFHARNPKWIDSMSQVTSKSLDNMDDDKSIIPLLQKKVRFLKNKQIGLSQHNNKLNKSTEALKDTSGGEK